jgi:enoyl-CoA hydratase
LSGAVATLEVEGRMARLVVDGAPGNVMGRTFFEGLARIAREVLPELDVDGMIVMGRGRHFSSGADVAELRRSLRESEEDSRRMLRDNVDAFCALETCRFPVVAAISGCCLGSGLELALACHRRVMASNAILAFPEVEHGIMPGCGGTVRLTSLLGASKAMELILTGRALSAEEALQAGLVESVTARTELLVQAERLALGAGWS